MFHSYFCFSIECALFKKLFFIIILSSSHKCNFHLEKISFQIYFSWDQGDSTSLYFLCKFQNILWFEKKGTISGWILTKCNTSLSIGSNMPPDDYRQAILEADIRTFEIGRFFSQRFHFPSMKNYSRLKSLNRFIVKIRLFIDVYARALFLMNHNIEYSDSARWINHLSSWRSLFC